MIKKVILGVFLILFLTACQSAGQVISPEDAKTMLEADQTIVLLDVRTRDEYSQGYIAGAILFPLATLETGIEAAYPNKNQTFIVYCRSGNRSREAVLTLIELGYKNIYDLGGIIDWPYEIVLP